MDFRKAHVTVFLCLCLTVVQISNTIEDTISPASVAAAIGSSVTLECITSHNTSVSWYHNNNLLQTSSQQLTLPSITQADRGIYKCCVAECTARKSASASIKVGDGPRQPLDLKCECRDYVNVNCSWTLGDTGDSTANVSLQISDLYRMNWITVACKKKTPSVDMYQYCFFNPFDFGYQQPDNIYRVTTANDYAKLTSDHIPFHRIAQAIPYPPVNITVQSNSSSSIIITWCQPKEWPPSELLSLRFKVEYQADTDEEWIVRGTEALDSVPRTDPRCKTIVVARLKPNTLYCVRISSRTTNAWPTVPYNEPSEPVCGLTMEGIRITLLNATDIKIDWATFQPLLHIDHFKVFYISDEVMNGNTGKYMMVNGTQRNVTISCLNPNTVYTVKIEAYVNSAEILNVGELHVTTKQAEPDVIDRLFGIVIGATVGATVLIFIVTSIVIISLTRCKRLQGFYQQSSVGKQQIWL